MARRNNAMLTSLAPRAASLPLRTARERIAREEKSGPPFQRSAITLPTPGARPRTPACGAFRCGTTSAYHARHRMPLSASTCRMC